MSYAKMMIFYVFDFAFTQCINKNKIIMRKYEINEIKTILNKYITTKHPKINFRKNKTKSNTNMDAYNVTMHQVLSENEPDLYNFLINVIDKNFTAQMLYNYINHCTEYCPICGRKLEFTTLLNGYKKCICDKIELHTKYEIYTYLCENVNKYFCTRNGFIEKIKSDDILGNLIDFTNIKTIEDLYLYLTDDKPHKCVICGKPTKFISFVPSRNNTSYLLTCSLECQNKLRSKQQLGENNTCHRISDETKVKMSKDASIRMKSKIKNGEFTPNVTNSWCHSLIKIKFIRNNKLIEGKYRSSWEAMFQLMHPDLLYEKLRIPYFDNNVPHTYIVDFIDTNNKKIYEIKPESLCKTSKNVLKYNALQQWAKDNDYIIETITEKYFIKNKFNVSLLKYCEEEYKNKIIRIISNYYSNFNIDYES